MNQEIIVEGVIYDPVGREIIPGRVLINNGRIEQIERDERITRPIILPGFVDSHIHIESSMLTPLEFSKIAIKHGTVAVVADPHEIANVAGVAGIDFMIDNSKSAKLKFFFGAPSCVPASPFDDCFQVIDSGLIEKLMERNDIHFLGEMMNFPGVINSNEDVINKIQSALNNNKPVDGHAPNLSGEDLKKYINAGIVTDHECFTLEEAIEKVNLGMKVLIREGSAAKNFINLNALVSKYPQSTMFCTDDCHPEDLINGHINTQVKRSLQLGHDIFNILQVASVNPIKHYNLDVGLLQKGDSADFIVIDNLEDLNIRSNYIHGVDVLVDSYQSHTENIVFPDYKFTTSIIKKDIELSAKEKDFKVIEVIEGELVTNISNQKALINDGKVVSDVESDALKLVVVNRYKKNELSVGFIRGFGLKKGAIAESIAHDSHHIIAVGVDDESIFQAIDYVINNRGGVCYFNGESIFGLTLPVYGLMSFESAYVIAEQYSEINKKVINDGCRLKAPFMTLSFMALSVIPKLKLTPKGLFDVIKFNYTDLFIK